MLTVAVAAGVQMGTPRIWVAPVRRSDASMRLAVRPMVEPQAPQGFVWGESFCFDEGERAIAEPATSEAPRPSPPPPLPAEPARSGTSLSAAPKGLSIEELTIRRRIGAGTQGEIRLGEVPGHARPVAIKLGLKPGAIWREAEVLSVMSGLRGFPTLLHHEPDSADTPGGALILALLGPSLEAVHRARQPADQCAPVSTLAGADLLRVGGEIIDLVRCLHQSGFIHNDIKPANLLLGPSFGASAMGSGVSGADVRARDIRDLHLIDFGSCTRAPASEGAGEDFAAGGYTVGPGPHTRGPMGSALFGSVAADEWHLMADCPTADTFPTQPADDLEAVVYTLIHLAAGRLPWHDQAPEGMQRVKRELLTSSNGSAAAATLTQEVDCPTAAEALRALYAEVRRCRGESRAWSDSAPQASVDYEACLAALW